MSVTSLLSCLFSLPFSLSRHQKYSYLLIYLSLPVSFSKPLLSLYLLKYLAISSFHLSFVWCDNDNDDDPVGDFATDSTRLNCIMKQSWYFSVSKVICWSDCTSNTSICHIFSYYIILCTSYTQLHPHDIKEEWKGTLIWSDLLRDPHYSYGENSVSKFFWRSIPLRLTYGDSLSTILWFFW